MDYQKTTKCLNTSCTFVKSWSDHYGDPGNVDDKPGKGRNHITSKSEDKATAFTTAQFKGS